ncbi:MAG TPA: hypothetical protein VGJ00_03305 [Rhabdochlamydiaceae bacterium]|jgi:hypothetical protein
MALQQFSSLFYFLAMSIVLFYSRDAMAIDLNSSEVTVLDLKIISYEDFKGGYILFSNLFVMINNKQPKLKAFFSLLNTCDIVCTIENENVALLRVK